jgi:beta-phosphoglucomutase-like phosphatase (HAD superfamily)
MHSLNPAKIELIMCDADGNLFPSEEPAFEASAQIVNHLMGNLGASRRFSASELRLATTGQNFRRTAQQLSAAAGRPLSEEDLEPWVKREVDEVTAHLARVLQPDAAVQQALGTLSRRFGLAAVTSSALKRLNACLEACGLGAFFPPDRRFSAEDSLPVAQSKPRPDIYLHALACTTIPAERALAIEDAVAGVTSARAAGVRAIGNVGFVGLAERPMRERELRAAGAEAVFHSWDEIVAFVTGGERLDGQPATAGAGA